MFPNRRANVPGTGQRDASQPRSLWPVAGTCMLAFILLAFLVVAAPTNAHAAGVMPDTPLFAAQATAALTLTIPGIPPAPIAPVFANPRHSVGQIPVVAAGPITTPAYYVVRPGDTLYQIAQKLGVDMQLLMQANGMTVPDTMEINSVLRVPSPDGILPPWAYPVFADDGSVTITPRPNLAARMTPYAQGAGPNSPFHKKTWLTYYGRPTIGVMGILGEHDIPTLTGLLKQKAAEYDRANGPQFGVQPAIHLVHGMATVEDGADDSHLGYLTDAELMPYIEYAQQEGVAVILDVQIANLSPVEAISRTLSYLKYPNVHLAIDPEFAMSTKGQRIPGNPIGYVTAEQVNAVQHLISDYLAEHNLPGPRVLLVHQFQQDMIVNLEQLETNVPNVAVVLSVDGFGVPYVKIWKYNALVNQTAPYTSFKIFYNWDEPVMTPAQALGIDASEQTDFIEITPNMIQYQ